MSDLADKIREQLCKHFIVQIECSHPVDRAHCICGWISPWAKNVGAAGELWVEHALSREVVLGLVGADRKSQLEATLACEKKDCERALLALAGWYPTPVEGYGYNTSWAISDLCKAVENVRARGTTGG